MCALEWLAVYYVIYEYWCTEGQIREVLMMFLKWRAAKFVLALYS